MEPIEVLDTRSFLFRGAVAGRSPQSAGVASEVGRPPDRVELSAPFLRTRLVDRIRDEIDAGNYETEHRIAAAAEAMMKSLFAR